MGDHEPYTVYWWFSVFCLRFSIQLLLFAILVNGVVVSVQGLMAIIGFGGVMYSIVAWYGLNNSGLLGTALPHPKFQRVNAY